MAVHRLRDVDLDLLVVLDALLATHHVSRAAERLALTPSAVSRALGRLRELFGDELLVRAGHSMRPTVRAERLRAPLRRLLDDAERLLRPPDAFDPATAQRRFHVATSDYSHLVSLQPLVRRWVARAPGIDFDVVGYTDASVAALERGELDLVIAPPMDTTAAVVWTPLHDDDFSCLMCADQPLEALTLDAFLERPHLLVAPRGRPGGPVDDLLAQRGLERRIALRTPFFLATPDALVGTPCIATLPTRMAVVFAQRYPLKVLPPPIALEPFTVGLAWHAVHRDDPGHRWLRAALADVARATG